MRTARVRHASSSLAPTVAVVALVGLALLPTSTAAFRASTGSAAAFSADALAPPTGVSVSTTCSDQAPPQFVSSSSASALNTPALSVPTPAGVQPGDVLLAVVGHEDPGSPLGAAGWTPVGTQASSPPLTTATFSRVVTTSEPATHTFTAPKPDGTPGDKAVWVAIAAYRGVDTASPVGTVATGSGASTYPTAPSTTVTRVGQRHLVWLAQRDASTVTGPPGMTPRAGADLTGGATGAVRLYDEVPTATGSTGSRTASTPTTVVWVASSAVLNPAPTNPYTKAQAVVGWTPTTTTWADGYRVRRTTGSTTTETSLPGATTSSLTEPIAPYSTYTYGVATTGEGWTSPEVAASGTVTC